MLLGDLKNWKRDHSCFKLSKTKATRIKWNLRMIFFTVMPPQKRQRYFSKGIFVKLLNSWLGPDYAYNVESGICEEPPFEFPPSHDSVLPEMRAWLMSHVAHVVRMWTPVPHGEQSHFTCCAAINPFWLNSQISPWGGMRIGTPSAFRSLEKFAGVSVNHPTALFQALESSSPY